MRNKLSKTFRVRHLPLSDGNDNKNFGGLYNFDWETHVKPEPAIVKTPVKTEPEKVVTASPSGPLMVYDVDKDCLVLFE
jgi:hypothetical protein